MDTDKVFCKCEPRIKGKKHWAVGGAGGTGLIAGWGRSPGEENDNRLVLPGESRGQRSLAGYSPRGRRESDTTE